MTQPRPLEWIEQPRPYGSIEYTAKIPGGRPAYDWYLIDQRAQNGLWKLSRSGAHPLLGELQREFSTMEEAKAVAEADWAAQQRLMRWTNFMINNEPPSSGPSTGTP